MIPELKKILISKRDDQFNFEKLIKDSINLEEFKTKKILNLLQIQIRNYLNEEKYQIILNKIFN